MFEFIKFNQTKTIARKVHTGKNQLFPFKENMEILGTLHKTANPASSLKSLS
ncbi:MAG TPA: hypothetical protein PL048_07435 [Leptospiraceae bacterium]|nr:hypothetical protein [Leptospiraceae bacterium]